MSTIDLDAIRARHAAATPGPWRWFGNTKSRQIYLATLHRGRVFVMQFVRWGMGSAQPVFQVYEGGRYGDGSGRMTPASELARYEVCQDCTDAADRRIYRHDLDGIRHADAEFIAHSWEDVDALLRYIDGDR